MTEYRKSVQAVFQDPWASLNPRMRVKDIVGEPLQIATTMTKEQIDKRVGDLLEEVGLNEYQSNFYPHEFSGGQRQRIGIARALAQKPKVMLADEPVASLDPITSRVVMKYLKEINQELGITTIVNLHFLDLAKEFGERLIGLKDGKLVYDGKVQDVSDQDFENIYGRAIKSSDLLGADD